MPIGIPGVGLGVGDEHNAAARRQMSMARVQSAPEQQNTERESIVDITVLCVFGELWYGPLVHALPRLNVRGERHLHDDFGEGLEVHDAQQIVLVRHLLDECVDGALDLAQRVWGSGLQRAVEDKHHFVQALFDYLEAGRGVHCFIVEVDCQVVRVREINVASKHLCNYIEI